MATNLRPHNTKAQPEAAGFTIIELLVVVAVIGILMGLLLPAIQAARESGRKTACMSNAYQLGMAVNRFDQDKGRVPRWQDSLAGRYVSWPVSILPYIERNDLYDLWSDVNTGNNPGGSVGLFRCSSSPPASGNASPLAYAANCGTGTMPTVTADGVMPAINVGYSLEDIADRDGTATTLLFAEKAGSEFQSDWTYPNNASQQVFSFQTNVVATSTNRFSAFGLDSPLPAAAAANAMPSSLHTGGGVVAFCDGHTYFLGNDVSSSVYTQLVTSSGANATPPFNSPSPLNEGDY